MKRSELINLIHKKIPNKPYKVIEKSVNTVFEEILHALESNKKVELRNFGSFFVKKRKGRQGVDPRDGTPINLQNRFTPFFRAGSILTGIINGAGKKKKANKSR